MNESDIEFTVGLDLSDAERKINKFQSEMRMADAAFERITGQSAAPRTANPRGLGIENFSPVDASLTNAARKFEAAVSLASEKLRMQAERAAARREYNAAYKVNDTAGMQTASEKFTTANQNLKNISDIEKANREQEKRQKELNDVELKDEEITNEAKAQNREMNEHHIKLGKTLTLLGLIKAAVEAIKKAWAGAFDRQAELMKGTGFLTMDPIGTFHANTDRTYAMIMAGLKHMGAAAPFQMGALNEFLTRIQTAKENAMMGKGVDENLTIAFQQLNDILGTRLNAEQLLTGDPTRSNVEIAREILDTLEKQLPKLASMDEMTRSRLMGYIRTAVGPELANALAANYNLNLRTGDTRTMLEKTVSHGGSEITNYNIADATAKITNAVAELSEALDKLKDQFLTLITGPLTQFTNTLTNSITVISSLFENPENFLPAPIATGVRAAINAAKDAGKWLNEKAPKVVKGAASVATIGATFTPAAPIVLAKSGKDYYKSLVSPDAADVASALAEHKNIDEVINSLWANHASVSDLLNAQAMASSEYKSDWSGGKYVENIRKEAQLYALWSAYNKGNVSGFKGSPLEKLAERVFKGKVAGKGLSFDKFSAAAKGNLLFMHDFDKLYAEGGVFDVGANDYWMPYTYGLQDLSPEDLSGYTHYLAKKNLIPKETGGRASAKEDFTVGGQAFIRIQLTDINGAELKTKDITLPLSNLKSNISNR